MPAQTLRVIIEYALLSRGLSQRMANDILAEILELMRRANLRVVEAIPPFPHSDEE
jgi:hypothetical protein